MDDLEKSVEAWLQNQRADLARDYATRGRRLQGLSTNELNERWIAAFKLTVTLHRMQDPERDDIESELFLRGLQPPYDAVKEEIEELRAATLLVAKQLSAKRAEEIGAEILEEIEEYKRRSEDRH